MTTSHLRSHWTIDDWKRWVDIVEYDLAAACSTVTTLRVALSECADRLETAAVHGGSNPEYAAAAVQRYRDLLAEMAGLDEYLNLSELSTEEIDILRRCAEQFRTMRREWERAYTDSDELDAKARRIEDLEREFYSLFAEGIVDDDQTILHDRMGRRMKALGLLPTSATNTEGAGRSEVAPGGRTITDEGAQPDANPGRTVPKDLYPK